MKRKSLLSFLGIVACFLLSVPASAGEDPWLRDGLSKLDGKTVSFKIAIRSEQDNTSSVDLERTISSGEISYERLNYTSYIYYCVYNGDTWGEKVPVLYFGSFDRATIHHGVQPKVCREAERVRTDLDWEHKEGVMVLTKPAGSSLAVGTFEVTNSVFSKYYETVEWGWKGLSTMYSRANDFTQHCLNYNTEKEKKADNTNFYMNLNWTLPSDLAGKEIKVGFHRAVYDNDGRKFIKGLSYSKEIRMTRIVESQDLKVYFSPGPSTYNGIKQVYMYCNTPKTQIYYTLDGSTPTTSSTAYNMYVNGPLLISQTTTIKAIAVYDNDITSSVFTATYTINPIEYVDFGLPSGTIWSTKNVGANKAEDFGNYYAWGEVEPKNRYTDDNYKWGKRNNNTKYQNDGRYRLEVQDDAASMNLGAQWRMPTKAQFEELSSKCNVEWTQLNGVDGYLFTSKKDETKSIFIPAASYIWSDHPHCVYLFTTDVQNMKKGYVWRYRADNGGAFSWSSTEFRAMGVPIRPVMNPNQPVTEYLWISGKPDKTKYQVGDKFDVTGLEVNYLPKESSAEKVTDSITWTVEPAVIYSGCTSVMVTASCKGMTTEPFKVAITNDGMPIDLGLSVQWSSFNLGSASMMGEGGYYTWNSNMNNDIADAFGSGWRLPTEAEVKELQDTTKCTWQWFPAGNSEHGGVAGYRVTGKSTGNVIFLPAIGCQSGSSSVGKGSVGNYWTSTTSGSNTYYMCFDAYDRCIGIDVPTNGRAVRIVKK